LAAGFLAAADFEFAVAFAGFAARAGRVLVAALRAAVVVFRAVVACFLAGPEAFAALGIWSFGSRAGSGLGPGARAEATPATLVRDGRLIRRRTAPALEAAGV
jgi:hypothetical protein